MHTVAPWPTHLGESGPRTVVQTRGRFGPNSDHPKTCAIVVITKGELGAYGLAERSDRIARPKNLIWATRKTDKYRAAA